MIDVLEISKIPDFGGGVLMCAHSCKGGLFW